MNVTADRIDAHQHYWHYDRARDDWIDPHSVIAADFTPEQVRPAMQTAGIDRAIAVQARSSPTETANLLVHAARHDWIAGVVGWLDLTAPDLDRQIAEHRARGPLVGLRHIVEDEPDGFLDRREVIAGVRATFAEGLAYDILIHACQLDALPRFLDAVGDGRAVLDHGAKPPIASGAWQRWADGVAAVATFPLVSCKLSGLVTEARHDRWRDDGIERYLDHLLACFGPDRLIFASDWPVCTLAACYDEVVALVRDWAARCCPGAIDAIFGGTAQRSYGLAE